MLVARKHSLVTSVYVALIGSGFPFGLPCRYVPLAQSMRCFDCMVRIWTPKDGSW